MPVKLDFTLEMLIIWRSTLLLHCLPALQRENLTSTRKLAAEDSRWLLPLRSISRRQLLCHENACTDEGAGSFIGQDDLCLCSG